MSDVTRSLRGNKDDTNTRDTYWFNISRYNWFGQRYCPWYECFPFGEDWPLHCSLRFAHFSVPAGAVVSKAHLLLTAYETDDHPNCHAIIKAEDVADPTQINNYADFMARPRTAQTVAWPNVPPFVEWNAYHTPDISPIIQHLIDTYPDTRSHIQLFIENNGSARDTRRVFRQGPGYKGNPAQLYIEYNVTPPPIAEKWLITDKTEEWSHTGKTITLVTDVPCHLYMRYTDKAPKWHDRPTMRRGVWDHRDPGWEMKDFDQLEQEEAGDTLEHTFILDPWPEVAILWYYFIGTIAGADVKSRSPFYFQYDGRLPPPAFVLLIEEPWTE